MDIKKVDFTGYQITLGDVMEQFDTSGKEMYEDIVDELLEDPSVHVRPAAFWKEISVVPGSEESVKLDNTEFFSKYLVKRLNGIEKAYAFAVTIGEELWQHRSSMSDALEEYLFDAIMKTSLNHAFEKTAEEIVLNLPDKAGLFMDNPGHISDSKRDSTDKTTDKNTDAGWRLADQKQFLSLLLDEKEQDTAHFSMRIDDRDHFETSYSLSGIIYARGIEPANCALCPKPECSHRKTKFDTKALVSRLHESAGGE